MRNKWCVRPVVLLMFLLSLSVAGCIQPITAPASAPANDPVAVFDAFNAAVNAHDVDAALGFFADDAVAQLPSQPPPNVFTGKTEIRNWLERDSARNIHVVIADAQVAGDTVTGTARVDLDDLRPLDITLEGTVEVSVQQGKITAFSYVLNDETLAKLQALQAQPQLVELPLKINSVTPYGHFNGIDYVKYAGRFVNTTNGEPFDAPFEIVAPADPSQGNGRLLVEPFHFIEGAGARDKFLTPEFLFDRGFSHAAICWQAPLAEIADHPCAAFASQPEDELRIIADFAKVLKTSEGAKLVGNVDKLYSIGFSNSADPLLRLLLDPLGQHLFDLSFVLTTGWPLPTVEFAPLPADLPASLLPAESAGRVFILLTEADIILWNAAVLRDDLAHPNYRSYEVAGVSHIAAPLYDANQLDWLPILHALFVAGDRWITDGVEPPPSRFLENAAAATLDPVYERPTGIARDENLNAKGGIRLPDLALGSSQFIAVDADNFALVGTFTDLKCKPLPDGSVRFADHQTYVSRFTQEVQRLVDEGFLLPDEAARVSEAAQASDVGVPQACP